MIELVDLDYAKATSQKGKSLAAVREHADADRTKVFKSAEYWVLTERPDVPEYNPDEHVFVHGSPMGVTCLPIGYGDASTSPWAGAPPWIESILLDNKKRRINKETIADETTELLWPGQDVLFARGCPAKPEHGFEDSIMVFSYQEILDLWDRMVVIDPHAELVLMKYIRASSSGIITPLTLSVGAGHDGATDGKDALVLSYNSTCYESEASEEESIQLNKSWGLLAYRSGIRGWLSQYKLMDSSGEALCVSLPYRGIEVDGPKTEPYLEVVCSRGHERFTADTSNLLMHVDARKAEPNSIIPVQCRAGVPLGSAAYEYVPQDIEVKNVLVATGEETLVEWRQLCNVQPPGTVAYHHKGSLSSHWGVNCQEFGIPYLTKKLPFVGDTLLACDYVQPTFHHVESELVAGICVALSANDTHKIFGSHHPGTLKMQEAMSLMLFALHNHKLQTPDVGSRLLGLGIGYAMRLLAAACIGEFRHKKKHGPGGKTNNPEGLLRHQIHTLVWDNYYTEQPHMERAWRCFRDCKWTGTYGGDKWAQCCEYQILMHTISSSLLRRLQKGSYAAPSKKSSAQSIGSQGVRPESLFGKAGSHDGSRRIMSSLANAFNEMVNLCHNNGWVFNKFGESTVMDNAAASSISFAASCIPSLEVHREFLKEGASKLKDPWEVYLLRQSALDLKNSHTQRENIFWFEDNWLEDDSTERNYNVFLVDKLWVKKQWGGILIDYAKSKRPVRPRVPVFLSQYCLRVSALDDRGKAQITMHVQWNKNATAHGMQYGYSHYNKFDIPLSVFSKEEEEIVFKNLSEAMSVEQTKCTSMAGGSTRYTAFVLVGKRDGAGDISYAFKILIPTVTGHIPFTIQLPTDVDESDLFHMFQCSKMSSNYNKDPDSKPWATAELASDPKPNQSGEFTISYKALTEGAF